MNDGPDPSPATPKPPGVPGAAAPEGIALTRKELVEAHLQQARRDLAEKAARMDSAELLARIEAAQARASAAATAASTTALGAALPSEVTAAAAGLPVIKLSRPNDKIQQADLRRVRQECDVKSWLNRAKAKVEELRVQGDLLPKNLKRLLGRVAELVEASGKGGAQQALSTLAQSVELCVRTVQKGLAFAVEHGLLIVMNVPKWEQRPEGGSDLRLQANLYLLKDAYKDVVVPEPADASDRTTYRQRYVAALLGLFARPLGVNTSPLRTVQAPAGAVRVADT